MWILLLVPFIGLLWVPFYNFAEPSLFGFPFFYWYQTLGTLLGTACTIPVYLHVQKERVRRSGKRSHTESWRRILDCHCLGKNGTRFSIQFATMKSAAPVEI